MNRLSLTAYRIFVLALANLLGGGIHDTIRRGPGWFSDPVSWVHGGVERPGAVHPFFLTSGLLLISAVVALALLWRYRGPGRGGVLATLLGTLAILVVTFFYFVPMSNALFAQPARLSDAAIILNSRIWVSLDMLRQLLMIGLLYWALVTLGRIEYVPDRARGTKGSATETLA